MILHGDALAMLQTLQDNSVDSLCCDPPAGIHFMNKEFDHDKGGRGPWVAWLAGIMRECLRVMKPGASGLVWSLPRTSHWTALALEDAGFEIRDSLYHLYPPSSKVIAFCESLSEEQQNIFAQVLESQDTPASIIHVFGTGFPKSSNIGIVIDKMHGAKREIVGQKIRLGDSKAYAHNQLNENGWGKQGGREWRDPETMPATSEAQQWEGWHTGLKPACEQWWLVRKPISEATVAKNVVKWGTGALNIDGCRVENKRFPAHFLLSHTIFCVPVGRRKVDIDGCAATLDHTKKVSDIYGHIAVVTQHAGYKDANGQEEIMTYDCSPDCPVRLLDEQSGTLKTGGGIKNKAGHSIGLLRGEDGYHFKHDGSNYERNEGGASRYFQQFYYAPKASRSERNKGCGELEEGERNVFSNTQGTPEHTPRRNEKQQNTHPTVKNLSLVRYLLRLLTPPGGICLDCFAGSGTTGVACVEEGFNYILIEKEQEYIDIIRARVAFAEKQRDGRRWAEQNNAIGQR